MNLTIKLYPPYCKKGEPDQFTLELKQHTITLEQLSFHLSRKWKNRFDYPLIDERQVLTAEFMVNGKHEALDFTLSDKDEVSVIPYLCGG